MMNYIPESALQLAIGLVFGTVFHFLDPSQEVYLRPDWFFLYLLPPIVLDAGFFLSNKDFFPNAGTIMVYAVFGTLWNIVMIALTLYGCSDYFSVKTSFIDLCLFATLISAVDPVAVIGVFERLHVNALLHICVFGESLLNDVVTVVLYKTLIVLSEVGTENMNTVDYVTSAVSFIFVSAEGIVFGALSGLLTSLATKYAQIDPLQPLILLLLPYLSYLISEGFGQSGILTIAVCGVVMRQYVLGNMDNSSQIASANCFKMLSSWFVPSHGSNMCS
uniref:Sodium/hydrogen exchanger n=1 Tax=Steinernema glaseri TaxID=37863 RepID=A0A1I7ZVS5_9BILA